ncbi:hypothetical protein OQJ15_12080 [Fluoribacter dumoffii]|uniref:Uncharacterized protein n=1 Tax=Fluoribacter dumoffii TaxID=463 RepID=A0A377G7I6_9GAMM|nr:hypothetical protein [Fluoribacter dumoffii]KTC92470.1 hypothetical protein Ldum_0276 [Fluoribacter dumoffii NY 23]MCW8387046.1 hypothetical protein [Fluoribacter dumoffii]MCW8497249.1 hypothetical protein [Fluoribacter dumoffii]STO20298.1 Uncharacterised protein [Fluoribacter dumoffii]
MFRLRLARHVIEKYQKKGIVHLPDFLVYDFDEEEYKSFWKEIASSSRQKLYTDGIDVFPVNWVRYFFESFKGWLGFENHCHPNRVEMTLGKIAYAGYMKGYKSQSLFYNVDMSSISDRFINLVHSPRTNQTSAELQQLLMKYFINHSQAFPEFNESIHENYPFGKTFFQEHLGYLAPSIDPQNTTIIDSLINQIYYFGQSVSKSDCYRLSTFAEAYSHFLVQQNRSEEALYWSPGIKWKFKEHFIDFYLGQKDTTLKASEKAMELIAELFLSSNPDDQKEAVAYIKNYFNDAEQDTLLTSLPHLRTEVAKAYLEDAKRELNKWGITKWLIGNQTMKFVSQSKRLDPEVLEQDSSREGLMIKKDLILQQFDFAIENNRFQDADALFKKNPDISFAEKKLERLREEYCLQFKANALRIAEDLASHQIETTIELAEEQIELAKKIVRIKPHDSLIRDAIVNYASTVVAVDVLKYPARDANRIQLNKAQCRLAEYLFLGSNSAVSDVYNQLLLRKIDCLIARLAVPIDYNDNRQLRSEFQQEHKQEIEALKKELTVFISANEKKPAMKKTLAKIYYLLADTLVYFEDKINEAIPYFKRAKELMPENLYYLLRYFEMIEDNRRFAIRKKIAAIGYLHEMKYNNYMVERWSEDVIMSKGFDIHEVHPEKSLVRSIGRTIGLFE